MEIALHAKQKNKTKRGVQGEPFVSVQSDSADKLHTAKREEGNLEFKGHIGNVLNSVASGWRGG